MTKMIKKKLYTYMYVYQTFDQPHSGRYNQSRIRSRWQTSGHLQVWDRPKRMASYQLTVRDPDNVKIDQIDKKLV